MEAMTLGCWMNDTPSSQAAGPQYVSLRVEVGKRKYDGGAEMEQRERVKGDWRVRLILFMNGWFWRVCENVYASVGVCGRVCVCVCVC